MATLLKQLCVVLMVAGLAFVTTACKEEAVSEVATAEADSTVSTAKSVNLAGRPQALGYTFTTEQCLPGNKGREVYLCSLSKEPGLYKTFYNTNEMTFEEFRTANRLPRSVTPDMLTAPDTVYVVGYRTAYLASRD